MNKLVNVRSYLTSVSPTFKRPGTLTYIHNLVNAVNQGVEITQDAILELMRHVNEVDVVLEKKTRVNLGDIFKTVTSWIDSFGGHEMTAKPKDSVDVKTYMGKEVIGSYSNRRTINYIERFLAATRDDAWIDKESVCLLKEHFDNIDVLMKDNPPGIVTVSHLTMAAWVNGPTPSKAVAA